MGEWRGVRTRNEKNLWHKEVYVCVNEKTEEEKSQIITAVGLYYKLSFACMLVRASDIE